MASDARRRTLATTSTLDVEVLLNWAELTYPQFFPGRQTTQVLAPYRYRCYDANGELNCVGVDGDQVAVLGPGLSGGQIQVVGTLADFECPAGGINCPGAVRGTALVNGADLRGAELTVKDRNGRTATAVTSAGSAGPGAFLFPDLRSMAWPLMARVSGGNVGCPPGPVFCTTVLRPNTAVLYGVLAGPMATDNVLNVSVMTDALVAALGPEPGLTAADGALDPAALFAAGGAVWDRLLTTNRLAAAATRLDAWKARLQGSAQVTRSADLYGAPVRTLTAPAAALSAGDGHLNYAAELDGLMSLQGLDAAELRRLVGLPADIQPAPLPLNPSPAPLQRLCWVAGQYGGQFTGAASGTWTLTVDAASGAVSGEMRGNDGQVQALQGSVQWDLSSNLSMVIGASATAGGVTLKGTINEVNALATEWRRSAEAGGTLTGRRLARGC
ncbi:hypothetical protein [Ideonella sp. A 288]|uniref:hypothetical protein n=1 Tax=Ideonella sp. A 288 TaxID=1962181 RepID=UPI000B4B2E70|nr:hypothetical protein [Ideonella sp. A 288]